MWGGWGLTAEALVESLDGAPPSRLLRVVVSTCYSGGFAELAFNEASPESGPSASNRCGLFATTWDAEASGCDPNPDRGAQEGYSLHFLHALKGEDRAGRPLPLNELDLDGDGRISLLEAHTRARIVSRSIDVPTTTSERMLRTLVLEAEGKQDVLLPEEDAVIARLGVHLSLPNEAAARSHLLEQLARRDANDATLSSLEEVADARYADLRIAILERWPVLDDPWHPEFPSMLAENRDALLELLDASPEAAAYGEARIALNRAAAGSDRQAVGIAVTQRLVRAYETRSLAGRAQTQAPAAFQHYERLLQCERSSP